MAGKHRKTLILIGGHEDREGPREILAEVARRVRGGRLVITTVASQEPDGLFERYDRAFRGLGVKHVHKLCVNTREEAAQADRAAVLDGAAGVFFTGGDQLKITSQLGDTPTFQKLHDLYDGGGLIAGTSAGASVVCDTMLVAGQGEESATVGESVRMAPGLGLLDGVIVDQHFGERGRLGRLLAAVAQNPAAVGVGIDENTAVVIEGGDRFHVLGDGAVYVVDGSKVKESNIADAAADQTLSIFGVYLHILAQGDRFDLRRREPGKLSPRQAARLEA